MSPSAVVPAELWQQPAGLKGSGEAVPCGTQRWWWHYGFALSPSGDLIPPAEMLCSCTRGVTERCAPEKLGHGARRGRTSWGEGTVPRGSAPCHTYVRASGQKHTSIGLISAGKVFSWLWCRPGLEAVACRSSRSLPGSILASYNIRMHTEVLKNSVAPGTKRGQAARGRRCRRTCFLASTRISQFRCISLFQSSFFPIRFF